jgi:hypothetical protein
MAEKWFWPLVTAAFGLVVLVIGLCIQFKTGWFDPRASSVGEGKASRGATPALQERDADRPEENKPTPPKSDPMEAFNPLMRDMNGTNMEIMRETQRKREATRRRYLQYLAAEVR